MATRKHTRSHTQRPPHAIKDALWAIRQQREDERDARLDALRAGHYAGTDALYAIGAFTRTQSEPCFILYTYTGSASGAQATIVLVVATGEYVVASNDTRFASEELIDALLAARLMAKERGIKATGPKVQA